MDLSSALEQFNVTHDRATGHWIADTRRDGIGVSQSLRRLVWPETYGVTGEMYLLEFDTDAAPLVILAPGETLEREGVTRTADGQGHFRATEQWMNSYGWPVRSMCCWLVNQTGYPSSSASARRGPVSLAFGVDLSGGKLGADARTLPLRPTWLGFAVNTVFYAVAIWMLFASPFVMRCRWRIKRGLCPSCGYPFGVSPRCTECGAVRPVRT